MRKHRCPDGVTEHAFQASQGLRVRFPFQDSVFYSSLFNLPCIYHVIHLC